MDGILGTNASLSADLTLLAYVLVLAPGMLLGFFFARRKMFVPHHKLVMTTIVIVNWVLILLLMAVSYRNFVAPALAEGKTDLVYLLPAAHLITGAVAQLLATYLVILMWTERTRFERLLPYRIKRIKTPMRITLGLWLATILLGVGIYLAWYTPGAQAGDDTPPPVATEEAPAPDDAEEADAPLATEEAPEPAATEESAG